MLDLKQGDCLELMKEISDKSIDMILCDLPYQVTQNDWDTMLPFDKLWEQYNRIIKDNGTIILFGQGLFTAKLMLSNEKYWRYNLIWDKILTSGFLNANKMPLRSHEDICVFYKNSSTYNPQKVLGVANHSRGKPKQIQNNNYGKFNFVDNQENSEYKHPKSILSFAKPHPSTSVHPTQKPTQLLEYLIRTYSNECDIVLDNCMGSGSTGVACINTNRNFIGMEINNEYFKIAEERIEKAQKEKNRTNIFNIGG